MISKEIWRPIPNYEGLYSISNQGRVQDRYGRILKQTPQEASPYNGTRYLLVSLKKEGKVKGYLVHRLVALTFLPNPNNYPIINHKNERRDDNRVENLEWCTHKYNSNYGTLSDRKKNGEYVSSMKKPVLCVETGIVYESVREARRQTKCNNINKALTGEQKRSGGFHWQYYITGLQRSQEEIIVTLY